MTAQDGGARRRPLKVLIIDDEKDLLELLSFRFQTQGRFSVETASDGVEGLAKVKSFKPDVVLLDLLMPEMDGWEVCRRLREDPATKALPIVIMTAARSPEVEARAHAAFHRIVFKPFNEKALLKMLADAAPVS